MKIDLQAPSDAFLGFSASFLAACGSPLEGAIRSRDFNRVVSAPFPSLSLDVDDFRDAYWAAEALSKTPFDIPGVNREQTALEKFFQAEEVCQRANSALCEFESRPSLPVKELRIARSRVAAILGKFSWDSCLPHMSFGPGASTSVPRRRASGNYKWGTASHITAQCLPLYLAFRRYNGGWWDGDRKLTIVPGNRVTTVDRKSVV